MDDHHHRDNWPFVIERKPVPNANPPVSPMISEREGSSRAAESEEEEDDRRVSDEDDRVSDKDDTVSDDDDRVSDEDEDEYEGSDSPVEISPIQSSRSSLEKPERPPNGIGNVQIHEPPASHESDDLYEDGDDDDDDAEDEDEDEDEERDIITPIPSAGLQGGAEPPNPFEADAVNGRSPPAASTPQSRSSSVLKGTPSSRTLPRRTPSITAQIPLNRQRVRYSWQSGQDEEPNRPRINVIKLVSNTATASAGFPQGEAFGFSISPYGRRIAAFNSARLYILQSQALPVGISQDYALKRKPLAVEVVDEGNAIAILADEYTVNVYDLEHQLLKRVKTIKFDNPTNCIALSPTGGLLAAGYEGGVEVFSLAPDALATDRRAVRSQKVDRLIFSKDSSTLVGTTTRISASSTVVISVPVFPASPGGIPTHDELKEAWCSELLQPENIRNSSHATFMRENRQTCNERLFAWNGLQETFGILRIPDMMYTNLDFPVVINPPLSTLGGLGAAIHCCPDVDELGDAVAMVVNDRTIRLYLVPRRADDNETIVEAHSIDHELDEGYGCPFSDVRWVQSGALVPTPFDNGAKQVRGRLIVASPGAVIEPEMSEEILDVEDVEGGRIIMFDFDSQHIGQPGQTFSLTLGNSPPQVLEEPDFDVAHEVAILRRRTVNQSKSSTLSQRPITLGRSATSSGNRGDRAVRTGGAPMITPSVARRSMVLVQSDAAKPLPHLTETNEALEPFEEPYAQNAPRSQASLQRAASNVQRHRFQALEEKTQEHISSDSNGNFLPLPEYTEEPNAPLPSRFRAMAGLDGPVLPSIAKPGAATASSGGQAFEPTSSTPTTPVNFVENLNSEEAFATARNPPVYKPNVQDPPSSPTANGSPVTAFRPPSKPGTPESMPPMSRSDTFQSLRPMNPRFVQRAYANAAFNPMATGPPPRLVGDWENVAPLVPSQIDRPLAFRQASLQTARLSQSMDNMHGQEQWDALSPLPQTNPSSPAFAPPSLSGPQYRFSTSQLNPPGYASPTRTEYTALPRAPSSAGSFAPSSMSSNEPSFRDMRLPPHMQAFRNAAAANATHHQQTPMYPPHYPSPQSPNPRDVMAARPTSNGGIGGGYPITAWHPPAPSSAPLPPPTTSHSRKTSLSNKGAFASTAKAKNLGFFRRGTQKNPPRLFGPEFASKQPGARPGTADSEDYGGAKSMFETKSIFTMRTKRGETRCSVM